MTLHTSIPGPPGEPRRGASVACPDHPDADVHTDTDETFDGAALVTRTTWRCVRCALPLTPETNP